jgi:hypothetical protein
LVGSAKQAAVSMRIDMRLTHTEPKRAHASSHYARKLKVDVCGSWWVVQKLFACVVAAVHRNESTASPVYMATAEYATMNTIEVTYLTVISAKILNSVSSSFLNTFPLIETLVFHCWAA